ncbi:MAG: hypothetical protein WC806_04465 [Candidatus Gracilibacteria bacterium]|jgi:hypothetical protein
MEKETPKLKHVLRMLAEKPNQLGEVLNSVTAMMDFPLYLLMDFFKTKILGELDAETIGANVRTAAHESGHLITDLFNGELVQDVWMTPFSKKTTTKMFSARGAVATTRSTGNPIEYTRIWNHLKELLSISDDKDNNGFLSGVDVQSTKVFKNMKKLIKSTYVLLEGTVGDFIISHYNEQSEISEDDKIKFLYDRTLKGGKADAQYALKQFGLGEKYERVPEELLKKLFLLLVDFFSDPKMKKIIEIFGYELLTKQHLKANGKEPLNKELIDLLEKNGISREEFKALKKKYFEYVEKGIDEFRRLLKESVRGNSSENTHEGKDVDSSVVSAIQEENHSDYVDKMGQYF